MIHDAVEVLRRAGHEACVLHGSPRAGYPDRPDTPRAYTHDYRLARRAFDGRGTRAKETLRIWADRLRGGPLPRLSPGPDDVVIVPEIMIGAAMTAFPRSRLGVFVQNPFTFQWAHAEAMSRGLDIRARAAWFLGVSEVCMDQFDLLGITTGHYLPVTMKPEMFPFRAEKEQLITYMPRKRQGESLIIVNALKARLKISGYRLESIDKAPLETVSSTLQKSRFFISLQKQESIGFPAAEAMAAGCIVVGYTGLGGREYFTPETGIPVIEDDTAGLVRALEAAVTEYESAPQRLDALRLNASETINRRYSRAAFEEALLRIWHDIGGPRPPS